MHDFEVVSNREIADGDFSKVEQIAREAMDVVKKVRG